MGVGCHQEFLLDMMRRRRLFGIEFKLEMTEWIEEGSNLFYEKDLSGMSAVIFQLGFYQNNMTG
ncbi:MAG: hypothetical protein JXB23_11245 [Candidatus Aminicenantes bacterium]|nr:hypothetical protein [Candidatus Aminicenantes bacterium]